MTPADVLLGWGYCFLGPLAVAAISVRLALLWERRAFRNRNNRKP